MSTDKDNHKSDEMKVEEKGDAKPDIKKAETNDVEKEVKGDNDEDKSSENESEPEPERVKKETPKKSASKAKETKKEEKSEEEEEEENDDEKDGDGEDDDDDDEDAGKNKKAADKDVPLLDQPLQVSGARERKKVERFSVDKSELKEVTAVEIPEGKGTALGSIGIIENNISKTKGDDLKKFHSVLFGRPGKATLIKKNIRKFNGFDFDKESEQHDKKKASLAKLDVKYLKDLAIMLDLPRSGSREDLAGRLMDFLMEPKGSDAPPPAATKGGLTKGGRPKRSAATKANNKGYSDGSDEDEDEEDRTPRSRRAFKGKRPNLKDDSSSEDDKAGAEDNEKGSDVDLQAEETPSSDESDDPKSKKKRAPPPKAPAKKSKKKASPAKKEKPAPKKRKAESEEEEDESSEDDQPLVKKTKTPPTDDDIKTYVKEILEGANLEEITMKTVCKQVYSHYPEFDLAHKKDFIKTTVKSLIST